MIIFGSYDEYKERAKYLQSLQEKMFETYAKEKELKELLKNLKPDNPYRKIVNEKIKKLTRSRQLQGKNYLEELNK